ncbi:alpha-2,3-sialyltransferase, partial [Helicobacter acinonychis]
RNFYDQHFTTGIMMLLVAIQLGYKEIYLCGIDFYENGFGHFYENQGGFFEEDSDPMHDKNIDIQALELAKKYAKIYALVPNSALVKMIPLSSQKGVLEKVKDRIGLGEFKR